MAVLETSLTPAEYLAQERLANFRSEYIDGEIREMAGASIEHDRIVGDIYGELRTALRKTDCDVFTSDVRVQMADSRFTYPDVTVVCGEPTFAPADVDTLANPTVIFEVLSSSTESYDLGDKARMYRQIDSLQGLVLVAQDRPWVEVWTRESPDSWLVREFTGLGASAELSMLELVLPMSEIYHRVSFEEQTSP